MYSTKNLLTDMWAYIQPHRKNFWLATSARIIGDIAGLYPPLGFAIIVNFFTNYVPLTPLTPVYTAVLFTILATIIRYITLYFAKTTTFRMSEKIALDAQIQAMKHVMLLDMSWHETESAGSKFKRIDRGAAGLDRILRIWINYVIEICINLIGIILIILKFDVGMGIALSLFAVTYYLLSSYYRKRAIEASDLVNAKEEGRSGILFEAINNIRSVKVMSMASTILSRLGTNALDLFETIKKRIFWFQTGSHLRNFYAQVFRIGVMIFIINGIIQGHYTIGFLVLFQGYFMTIWTSLMELTDASEEFATAQNAIGRMQEILRLPITIDDEAGKVKFPEAWQTITIKNVSFAYQDTLVMNNVSFEVKRGEKIGIVGLSGAGKSTLFKLLLKEHESYTGDILFDKTSLTKISKKNYFRYLAVVLQDTELFNTSLRDNITITNQKQAKNKRLLKNAIQIAHVKDFMAKLPEGVDSVIGEKGVKLSGGEKQRVGIARAIFKNPQIFLLDEATSHLDLESEEKIQDSLHKFFKSVTAIVIAHRLTTIKEMDRILVMEDGKIIESGNFADLYKARGRFFELWEKQKL